MESLLRKISMPAEVWDSIFKMFDKIAKNPELKEVFESSVKEYLADPFAFETGAYMEWLSKELDEHIYSAYLAFYIECAKGLPDKYAKLGIDEEICFASLEDISVKAIECKKLYGVYGVDVPGWYKGIFDPYIFRIGRLEYAAKEFKRDSYKDFVKKGDRIYELHIPSAGPLTRELVIDSFKKAYEFYKCEGNMIIFCSTWMLYSPYSGDIFSEGSNLQAFYDLFDVIDQEDDTPYPIYRWIFSTLDESTPVDKLPTDTSLQRKFINRIKAGKPLGSGHGIIVFDGEKIINK